LKKKKLNLILKLNPTLIGKTEAMEILHGRLGFTDIEINDATFEHDLQYPRGHVEDCSLRGAVELPVIYNGVKASAPWLMECNTCLKEI